ncbi:uncharacterized protein [Cherax quadricarinatus]|nr:uncharacterized protein LOC128703709 [Cherax quadricarinatus]
MNTEYIPRVSWLINDRPAHSSYVRQVNQRTVGLVFQARDDYFQRGVITVSCVTSLGNKHVKATQVQLPNRSYLSAQEYYHNAGQKKTGSGCPLAALLILKCFYYSLVSLL